MPRYSYGLLAYIKRKQQALRMGDHLLGIQNCAEWLVVQQLPVTHVILTCKAEKSIKYVHN